MAHFDKLCTADCKSFFSAPPNYSSCCNFCCCCYC